MCFCELDFDRLQQSSNLHLYVDKNVNLYGREEKGRFQYIAKFSKLPFLLNSSVIGLFPVSWLN